VRDLRRYYKGALENRRCEVNRDRERKTETQIETQIEAQTQKETQAH
jgi:hypothetical protein